MLAKSNLPLVWLVCTVVTAGVSMWVAGALLQSRPGYRKAVQIAMILAALVMMFLAFLHGAHPRGR